MSFPAENTEELDVKALATDVGNELFPPKDPAQNTEAPDLTSSDPGAPNLEAKTPAEQTPGTVVPGQNSNNPNPNAIQSVPLPKSWKKEMEPHWAKMPAEVHAYVQQREADVMRGIQMYQGGYKAWDTLIRPFAPLLEQNPDVNPVQLMQGLMNTHLTLLNPNGDKAQKVALIQGLLQEYGISLDGVETPKSDQILVDRLNKAEQKLAAFERNVQIQNRQTYETGVNAKMAEVEAFAKDPKNEFFQEVENDIFNLIRTGTADTLAKAYELAIWTNPGVRAKMLAKQQAPSNVPNARDPKSGKFVNLEETPGKPKTQKVGTMDQTIDAIVASHYPSVRH